MTYRRKEETVHRRFIANGPFLGLLVVTAQALDDNLGAARYALIAGPRIATLEVLAVVADLVADVTAGLLATAGLVARRTRRTGRAFRLARVRTVQVAGARFFARQARTYVPIRPGGDDVAITHEPRMRSGCGIIASSHTACCKNATSTLHGLTKVALVGVGVRATVLLVLGALPATARRFRCLHIEGQQGNL